MNRHTLPSHRSAVRNAGLAAREAGAVLPISLILLFILAIIGVSAMRGTVLEERMSGNLLDRNKAFQAAEAALRHVEAKIESNPPAEDDFTAECSNGLCTVQDDIKAKLDDQEVAQSYAGELTGLAGDPVYLIEYLGATDQCEGTHVATKPVVFRITTRAVGANRNTTVYLQSRYIKRIQCIPKI